MTDLTPMISWVKGYGGGKFKFAGIADDGEVFIQVLDSSYLVTPTNAETESIFITQFKAEFPEAKKLTFVVQPSIQQVDEMLRYLNSFIEESQKPQKPLLKIGGF